MFRLNVLLLSIALLPIAGVLWASDADELREQASVIRRDAAELAERGRRDEAENLERKANEMLELAENLERTGRHSREPEIRELERHLEELHHMERRFKVAGNQEAMTDLRQEVERVEQKLRMLHDEDAHRPVGAHGEIARRLEHMHAAVEHLNQAGLPDIARQVAEQAEATQRELQMSRQNHSDEPVRELINQFEELRREVSRLRDEINELKEER